MIDDTKLAELRARYPGLRVVNLSDGRTFAFRVAAAADWKRHRGAMMGLAMGRTEEAASADEVAARSLCVYPEDKGAAFDQLAAEAPHVAAEIGGALIAAVGAGITATLGEP